MDLKNVSTAHKLPQHPDLNFGWTFYCDSDFAGNDEKQNKRRSQNSFVALLNGAPVFWYSKVSSVGFAHPDIGKAHADMSSGAAEVYAAANATFDALHMLLSCELLLPHTEHKLNIPTQKPNTLVSRPRKP